MSIIFHADDFGLNPKQAGRILSLSKVCGNSGRLTSVSIFPNSPSFKECTQLAKPFIEEGKLRLYCVDTIDAETWSCTWKNARDRIVLHEDWMQYLVQEGLPLME